MRLLKTTLTATAMWGAMTLSSYASISDGYVGITTGDEITAEMMVPISRNIEIRTTTDFTDTINILPTVSINLGKDNKLYTGLGLNYEENDFNMLLRVGGDWNLSNGVVGITYLDYTDSEVTGNVGVGYKLGDFDSESTPLTPRELPRDRN